MAPPPGTFEIDLRRRPGHSVIQALEKTTGLAFNIRRARVTPRRSHFVLEIVSANGTVPQARTS